MWSSWWNENNAVAFGRMLGSCKHPRIFLLRTRVFSHQHWPGKKTDEKRPFRTSEQKGVPSSISNITREGSSTSEQGRKSSPFLSFWNETENSDARKSSVFHLSPCQIRPRLACCQFIMRPFWLLVLIKLIPHSIQQNDTGISSTIYILLEAFFCFLI